MSATSAPAPAATTTSELLEDLLHETRRAASEQSTSSAVDDERRRERAEKEEALAKARMADARVKALLGERDNLAQALRDSDARAKALQTANDQLRVELDDLLQSHEALRATTASLEAERDASDARANQREAECAALRQESEAAVSEMDKMKAMVVEHIIGPQAARDRAESNSRCAAAARVSDESRWDDALTDLQQRLVSVTLALDQSRRDCEERDAIIATQIREADELRRDVQLARDERDSLNVRFLAMELVREASAAGEEDPTLKAERRRADAAERETQRAEQRYLASVEALDAAQASIRSHIEANESLREQVVSLQATLDARAEALERAGTDVALNFDRAEEAYQRLIADAQARAAQSVSETVQLRIALEEAKRGHLAAVHEVNELRTTLEGLRASEHDAGATASKAAETAAEANRARDALVEERDAALKRVRAFEAERDGLVYVAEKSILDLSEVRQGFVATAFEAAELESTMRKCSLLLQHGCLSRAKLMAAELSAVSTPSVASASVADLTRVVEALAARCTELTLSDSSQRVELQEAKAELARWHSLFPTKRAVSPQGPEEAAAAAAAEDVASLGFTTPLEVAEDMLVRYAERGLVAVKEVEVRVKLSQALQATEEELQAAREQLASVAPRQGDFFAQQRSLILKHLVHSIRALKHPKMLLEAALRGHGAAGVGGGGGNASAALIAAAVKDGQDELTDSLSELNAVRRSADRIVMRCFTAHERNEFATLDTRDLDVSHSAASVHHRSVSSVGMRSPSSVGGGVLYSRTGSLDRSSGVA